MTLEGWSFGNWYVLLGLFVPAAMLVWVWRRKSGRVVLPQDYGGQRSGRFWAGLITILESAPPLLLAIVAALLITSGPGPKALALPIATVPVVPMVVP